MDNQTPQRSCSVLFTSLASCPISNLSLDSFNLFAHLVQFAPEWYEIIHIVIVCYWCWKSLAEPKGRRVWANLTQCDERGIGSSP